MFVWLWRAGCGYINPARQIRYADFVYEHGIVDWDDRQAIVAGERAAREAIEKDKYYVAWWHVAQIALKAALAGYRPPYDVRQPSIDFSDHEQTVEFVQKSRTRAAIHVGSQKFRGNARVVWFFRADLHKSAARQLSAMLDHYHVLLFAGQFDMIIPPSQTDEVIASLGWAKLNDFQNAERRTWHVRGKPAGYRKTFDNLELAFVREANHAVVGSQPAHLFDLLNKFCAKFNVTSA